MSKKTKKKGFDEELYGKLSINNLILFSINYIESSKKSCTFEDLIEVCFRYFPGTFSFENLSRWPDSRKLDRPLRTLRNRKLIKGGPAFSLTETGRKIAKDTTKFLTQKKLL